jgi:hypothetical protein
LGDTKVEQQLLLWRAETSAQQRSRVVWLVVAVLMSAILLAPAIWNRFPLLQYDTGGYLARWFEGYLVPSRPGAYGLLLAATAALEFWPVLVLQAAVTIGVLALLFKEFELGDRPWLLLATMAMLSAGTALPWLTSILLTDIFAGLAVLALHLIVFGRHLRAGQQWGLVVLVAFAAATHSATLVLIVVLTGAIFVVAVIGGSVISAAAARRAATALALGVTMTLTANFIVSGRFAFTPGGYGILFGRMLQDGIASRYLDDHCPDPALKLCPFRHELPRNADAFLWGESVFNRLGRFDGLGDEMRAIVLGSLRDYPRLQAETAIVATAAQLVKVGGGEGVIDRMWHTYGIMQRHTPAVMPSVRAARQQHGEIDFTGINRIQVPIALGSMALLPLLLLAGLKWPELAPLGRLSATVMLALLINAFVCGALSNPHDRYGARLVWPAPFAILLVPLSIRARSPEPQGRVRRVASPLGS